MAAVKLTRRTVSALQAKLSRYFVYDVDLKGFGVRVMPSGAMSYIVEYRPGAGGRGVTKKRITLGSTDTLSPEEARKEAGTILSKVKLGGDPASDRKASRAALTVKELVEVFMAEHVEAKRKPSTAKTYRELFYHRFVPEFGTRKAADLASDELARLHLKLKRTPGRANRLLAIVSSMYNFAQAPSQKLVPKGCNPAADIERYRTRAMERFLSTDELARIGDAIREAETLGVPWTPEPTKKTKHAPRIENRRTVIDPFAAAALRLLLLTGARLSEILTLRWEWVDVQRGLLLLPDSKTGKKAVVLNAPALSVLDELPRLGSFVIAGASAGTKKEKPRADLKRPWMAVARLAGLVEVVPKLGKDKKPIMKDGEPVMRERISVRIHDLRHTHASYGAGLGLGLPIIGKLLGHAQASTTQRYAHLDNDPVRKASERIGGVIAAAMGDKTDAGAEVVPIQHRKARP
jgi:integrase